MVKTPSFQTLDSASGSAPSEPDGHPPGLGRRSDAAPRISRRVPHYSRVERRFGLQVVSRRFVKKQQMQWTLCGAPFAADKDKGPQRGSGRPIPPLVSKIQVATTNAGARAEGGLTPDFLALSVLGDQRHFHRLTPVRCEFKGFNCVWKGKLCAQNRIHVDLAADQRLNRPLKFFMETKSAKQFQLLCE